MVNLPAKKSISADKKSPMQGIVPPLVTPRSARDELDQPGLRSLIDHVVNGGVSGIFILGTTGEALSLSYRLRREMIYESVDLAKRS